MGDLIIYFHGGATARFQKVTEFNENENRIAFRYHGVSTGLHRKAEFNKNTIAGFAYAEKE